MAIKLSINKLNITGEIADYIKDVENSDITILPIEKETLSIVASLPFLHRDPFDRLIIAQAIYGGMQILSKDVNFHRYGAAVAW